MPFGFDLGLSGKKTSSTTNTTNTFNNTTTPIVPDWASGLTQDLAGQVHGLVGRDPYGYVAPANGLQTQAAGSAARLTGSPWNFDSAADLTRAASNTSWLDPYMHADTPFASGGKAYDYIDRYMDPYLNGVVNAAAADFDANAGEVRARQALDLAGSGAFGGSGAALTQSMTEGELARARASTLSALRSQGFTTALGAAAGDAERATQARLANAQTGLQDRAQKAGFGFQAQQQQLAAANQLAGLSSGYDANLRANLDAQAGLGNTLRQVDQDYRQAPITNAQQLVAMLSGLPINLFVGSNEQGTKSEAVKSKGSELSANFGFKG